MRRLSQEQFLPITLEEAWSFFSNPRNLNEITPEDMVFKITSNPPAEMYPGLFITYKIKPILNIEFDWCTEITHVTDRKFFVDEQRKGPYAIWHHEHHFQEVNGGVLMTDIVHYYIGKGPFGWIAGKLFVHKRVEEIFTYRTQKLNTLFPAK
jgi:ligand-binding SRPBCC domain-containing protein